MKKQILFILFSILLSMVGTKALAVEIDGIYYDFSGAEATVGQSNNCSGDLLIPESITYNGITYSVTSIGEWAFDNCEGLTSVTIPNSVTSIGSEAFYGCTSLTSIEIPNSVTSIGGSAFSGCSVLTSVTIGNSVTSIGSEVFSGTAWYNNQPDGLVYAGKVAYKYKGTMPANTSITIKEGTLGIAGEAFYGCSGLTSIEIPNSVTSIEWRAFRDCRGLTSIEIPNSVTSIGDDAFEYCSGLTSIEIPNSVTSIGDRAFRDCTGLTSITIGNSVTSIGYLAFSRCSGLISITCLVPNPPSCERYVFDGVDKSACILMVPESSIDLYKTADEWKDFSIIEATGIQELRNGEIEGLKYYDLNGNQSSQPHKGLNIVRMSNGKTKKVLVK